MKADRTDVGAANGAPPPRDRADTKVDQVEDPRLENALVGINLILMSPGLVMVLVGIGAPLVNWWYEGTARSVSAYQLWGGSFSPEAVYVPDPSWVHGQRVLAEFFLNGNVLWLGLVWMAVAVGLAAVLSAGAYEAAETLKSWSRGRTSRRR